MADIAHDSSIEWPNGLGWTPCSTEYRETMDARDTIYSPTDDGLFGGVHHDGPRSLDDLSPDDYQRWNVLDDKLGSLHLAGHLGKSERY